MIYSGSVIFIDPSALDEVEEILAEFDEIDIHTTSEDNKQIVISIEVEGDETLDELTKKLKSYEPILDVGHHIMHFEEEVQDIIDGKKIPDLKAFQRSKRRKENPLEAQLNEQK